MPDNRIQLHALVQSHGELTANKARSCFEDLLAAVGDAAQGVAVHEVEARVHGQVMALGGLLVGHWLAKQLPHEVVPVMTHAQASYGFAGLKDTMVRTRFGEVACLRPLYTKRHGKGPASLSPYDRTIGLADGRMTLGVHLQAAWLSAKLPFDEVIEVVEHFGEYAPSKRAILGIVDSLGPSAAALLADMPEPECDGEVLVIQCDDKGAPMLGTAEHQKRCKPRAKQSDGRSRAVRRERRRVTTKVRRPKGKKSKNARMSKVFVIYTLRKTAEGKLDGPFNKRVIATFGSRRSAFEMAKTEAVKRGYGTKETYFLADGSQAIWSKQAEFFPLATACVDWYHVCEYLWKAGTVLEEGSRELTEWVHGRKVELMAGDLDKMYTAIADLRTQIPNGKAGDAALKRHNVAFGYLLSQRGRLVYRQLGHVDMDIATGAVEGAVNHVVGNRLDGSMMRWSPARAGHVLALRCLVINRLWQHFSRQVSDEHSRQRGLVIGRITPSKPQEPYDAVPKAA